MLFSNEDPTQSVACLIMWKYKQVVSWGILRHASFNLISRPEIDVELWRNCVQRIFQSGL